MPVKALHDAFRSDQRQPTHPVTAKTRGSYLLVELHQARDLDTAIRIRLKKILRDDIETRNDVEDGAGNLPEAIGLVPVFIHRAREVVRRDFVAQCYGFGADLATCPSE